jgi:site-specific DNA recombinase
MDWGYGRVSTDEQTMDSDALGKQIQRLKDAGCSRVYFDVKSRSTESRDGLNQLIKDLKASTYGEVHTLKFTRIDRIGSSSRLFYSLLEILKQKGIKLVALDQAIDPDSLGGELTIDMLIAASKFEVKMLSHRVSAELKVRRSQGKAHNVYPFGFVVADGKYIFDTRPIVCLIETKVEYTYVDVAKLIFELFFELGSISKVCKQLHLFFGIEASQRNIKETAYNVIVTDDINKQIKYKTNHTSQVPLYFSKTTIRNILVNPIYAGGIHSNIYEYPTGRSKKLIPFTEWVIDWETHNGIISYEDYQQITTTIVNNRNNRWASNSEEKINPYNKIAKCAHCGGGLIRQYYKQKKTGDKEYWYQCTNYREGRCAHKKMISEKKLDIGVAQLLETKSTELGDVIYKRASLEVVPGLIENDELRSLRKSLNSLKLLDTNDYIRKAISETEDRINYLIKNSDIQMPDFDKISAFAAAIGNSGTQYWLAINNQDKRRFLSNFVSRIIIDAPIVSDITLSFRV